MPCIPYFIVSPFSVSPMSDFNQNVTDAFSNPFKEIAIPPGEISNDEENVGSPVVLETLRPPVIAVVEESVTLDRKSVV